MYKQLREKDALYMLIIDYRPPQPPHWNSFHSGIGLRHTFIGLIIHSWRCKQCKQLREKEKVNMLHRWL